MLGNIKIYFGKVVDISDSDKMEYRARISIDGYTETIATENLPWYYNFGAFTYLPEIDDVVPVIVFDNNFTTCFYLGKVSNKKSELSEDDYKNYLEIFKRNVDGDDVSLTYKKSEGIIFSNKDGKIQILPEQIFLYVAKNSISITKDKIEIGDGNKEATILGDKGVKMYEDILSHQKNIITQVDTILKAISAACTTPYTIPIGTVITTTWAGLKATLDLENTQLSQKTKQLQSKKVFIE